MSWWGVAYCQGPNYNDPVMTTERSAAAWKALQEARACLDNTTPVERALIEALGHRYAKPWPEDRTSLEQAYADAMAVVWESFPDDTDDKWYDTLPRNASYRGVNQSSWKAPQRSLAPACTLVPCRDYRNSVRQFFEVKQPVVFE
jgi:hypothetical protein